MRVFSRLEFNEPAHCLKVQEHLWREALAKAVPDPVVGIRHEAIAGDADYRIHVAAIPHQVGCHFHAQGSEVYEVVEGAGRLHFGQVVSAGGAFEVNWETPVDVATGDRFVIPEGYAHQLRKQGEGELTILFACPDSHLDDAVDRTILPDAPR
ncbi:MAG TPA: cupin domain-containing protein [Candidatus Obscuribacterales bacterium]